MPRAQCNLPQRHWRHAVWRKQNFWRNALLG
jgi:hypothetical protein